MSQRSSQLSEVIPPRSIPPVSLHITIEFAEHDETDHLEHDVEIKMAGMASPLLSCRVGSDFYERPRILKWYDERIPLGLPQPHRDAFALLCYEIMVARLYEAGGVRAWLQMRDARRWLEIALITAEADELVDALLEHAVPGVVIHHDESCVDID